MVAVISKLKSIFVSMNCRYGYFSTFVTKLYIAELHEVVYWMAIYSIKLQTLACVGSGYEIVKLSKHTSGDKTVFNVSSEGPSFVRN